MPTAPIRQNAFVSGEVSPSMYGRVDLPAYVAGLRRCENFIIRPEGGLVNRPGFRFVAEVHDSSVAGRLIPFVFSEDQSYVLEFGEQVMRVFRNGALVVYPAVHPMAGQVVEVTMPYTESDLPLLRYAQSADVMTLVHPSHAPRELTRTDHHDWTLSTIQFEPTVPAPVISTVVPADAATAPTRDYEYVVTAVNADGEESVGSVGVASGAAFLGADVAGQPSDAITVTWAAAAGAVSYNVYRGINGQDFQQFVGSSKTLTFLDRNIEPTTESAPIGRNPFNAVDDYPGIVTIYQNRRFFARTNARPETVFASQSSNYNNFSFASPPKDNEAIEVTIASEQVQEIVAAVSLGQLVLFTKGQSWYLSGGQEAILTPSNTAPEPGPKRGAAAVQPIVIGNDALFIERKQSSVRSMRYLDRGVYEPRTLSILSNHLVKRRTLSDWAYAETPLSFVGITRDDGVLLTMTYEPEHEVTGWARTITDGEVGSVTSIPTGKEDVFWAIVKRTVNGQVKRYVEFMETRFPDDPLHAFHVDSGLSLDGRGDGTTTVTVTGASYDVEDPVQVAADADVFAVTDIGARVRFVDDSVAGDTREYDILIEGFSGARLVTGSVINTALPAAYQNAARTDWALAYKQVRGLGHLEGKSIMAFGDGHAAGPFLVTGGATMLDRHYRVISAGLPYVSELETLTINLSGRGQLRPKHKVVPRVWIEVEDTAGLLAGEPAEPQEPQSDLDANKPLARLEYVKPPTKVTDVIEVAIASAWNRGGRVIVRQEEPIPTAILGILPELDVGK